MNPSPWPSKYLVRRVFTTPRFLPLYHIVGLKKYLLHFVLFFKAKVIDTLDLYAPALKGLTDVHAYACETLESIIFDRQNTGQRGQAAAFLYGTFFFFLSKCPLVDDHRVTDGGV